jgi:hypothetical protein
MMDLAPAAFVWADVMHGPGVEVARKPSRPSLRFHTQASGAYQVTQIEEGHAGLC